MNITLTDLPTSSLLTSQGQFASILDLFASYNNQSRSYYGSGPYIGPIWSFYNSFTGGFQAGSGFRTNYIRHNNIFKARMFDILHSVRDVDAGTIIQSCQINYENITARNLLTSICPIAMREGSMVKNVLEELERGKEPGFLARALLPLVFMDPRDLQSFLKTFQSSLLPKDKETREIFTIAITMLLGGNSDLIFLLQNLSKWRSHLSSCGVHNITVTCSDQTKDYCESGQLSSAVVVLLAIFLPGLIQALANLMFYKVREGYMIVHFKCRREEKYHLVLGWKCVQISRTIRGLASSSLC